MSDGQAIVALARLRIEAGLSRRQLAERAGLWPSSVSRAERGDYVLPEVREALVRVLGVEARPLISVRGPEPDTPVYWARITRSDSGREAAKRAGVTKDVLYRAEHGLPIHPANAKRIADALGLEVLDVLAPKPATNAKPRKRRRKPAGAPRDGFRREADERAARAALVPHTGNVAVAAKTPPIKGT
jgi:transcriptional regulator with XRE-family HTH domain